MPLSHTRQVCDAWSLFSRLRFTSHTKLKVIHTELVEEHAPVTPPSRNYGYARAPVTYPGHNKTHSRARRTRAAQHTSHPPIRLLGARDLLGG
eukprot:7391342-Prymnesium_polylepis.1